LVQLSTPLPGLENLAGTLKGKTFSTGSFDSPTDIVSILNIDGIESIYAMATALTINKKASAKWEQVLPSVMEALGNDQQNQDILLQGLLALTAKSTNNQETTSSAGQVRMRLQISNKISIQIEGTGHLGTVQRMQLPHKFQEYMALMQEDGNVDFFGGRTWIDRGMRYLPEDVEAGDASPEEQERLELKRVLDNELEEVAAAYPDRRLADIIAKTKDNMQKSERKKEVVEEESVSPQLDLEAVDRLCDLAELGDLKSLNILAKFVSSHQGSTPARRNALAYLGGTGGSTTDTAANDSVFLAIVSALQHEKSAIMRRTAGDAVSDLGDPRAISYAITALGDKSKLVQWRAARILGELGDETEILAELKQASFSSKYAFEVAFEIKDALRKVKARVQQRSDPTTGVSGPAAPKTGPIWKQIQEGAVNSLKKDTE